MLGASRAGYKLNITFVAPLLFHIVHFFIINFSLYSSQLYSSTFMSQFLTVEVKNFIYCQFYIKYLKYFANYLTTNQPTIQFVVQPTKATLPTH